MLNYSCAPQNPTKDLLRCRYGGWWWHLVWRLHNYLRVFSPLMQMWVFWDGLVTRCLDVRSQKTNSLSLFVSNCLDIVKVVISCWPLILFTTLWCIHYSKQCTNPAPPIQAARNKTMSCFLLSLQWAAIQIDWKSQGDYRNEIKHRREERHKICMLGPLCYLWAPRELFP